jgi:hypothetical protein
LLQQIGTRYGQQFPVKDVMGVALASVLDSLYVFSVEDAAGNSRARERVDGIKKNQGASETRHTGVSALRASPIDRTADHWLTPAAIASRLCEPVRTNAKHKR